MKRILEMFGEPISYGGQESVVYNMLSVFNLKDEFHADLYTPYFADNRNLIDLIEKNGGSVYKSNLEFKTGDNRFNLNDVIDDFFALHHDYDVVHIHTGSLTTMVVYAKLAKKYGIKNVIVHSHTVNIKKGLFFRARRFILNMMIKQYADVYLGCSLDAIDSKFKLIHKDKLVIYNGIDIDSFRFNEIFRNEIRHKYNIDDRYIIGSLGRVGYPKNNKFMINIIADIVKFGVKDIVLLMVGDGEDLESVKEYAMDLGVLDYVVFPGNQTDTYKYYSAFDIFLLPSIFEGLPVTSIEAQVSGLLTMISKNVDRSCSIAKTTEFLDISDPNIWAKRIIDIKNSRVFNRNTNIDFDKFDRRLTYNKVKEIYNS